jgi:hypothetical protein
MALERLSPSLEMAVHGPCAKKEQNLVPGARVARNSLNIEFRIEIAA